MQDLKKYWPLAIPLGLGALYLARSRGVLGLSIATLGSLQKTRGDFITFKVKVYNATDAPFEGGLGVAIKDSAGNMYDMNYNVNAFIPYDSPASEKGLLHISLNPGETKDFYLTLSLPENIAYGDIQFAIGVWERSDPANPGNWLAFYPSEGPGHWASTDSHGNKITIIPIYELQITEVTVS